MPSASVTTVQMDAAKGVRFDDAVRDALILALTENRHVVLTFNDVQVDIDPNAILKRLCSDRCS